MGRRTLFVGLMAAALLAGVALWVQHRARIPEGLTLVNGRIEGDPVVVSSKVPGRIIALVVSEGQQVEMGQAVATIGSEQIRAQVGQSTAALDAAGHGVEAAQGQAAAAKRDLARAEAGRVAAKARYDKAVRDAARFDALLEEGVVARSQADDMRAARDVAAADLQAAEESVSAAQRAVEVADQQVEQLGHQVEQARGALAETRATLGDAQVLSPIRGVVQTKVAEQGEVLQAGAPIAVVVDLDRLHMKAYVPEPEIGRVKIGDPARVYVDAYPDRPFAATVREIAPRSEFTPKEVQTREERVKQVIAVKLALDANPDHRLVPGMPADAVIRWKPEAPWINPLER